MCINYFQKAKVPSKGRRRSSNRTSASLPTAGSSAENRGNERPRSDSAGYEARARSPKNGEGYVNETISLGEESVGAESPAANGENGYANPAMEEEVEPTSPEVNTLAFAV